MSNNTKLIARSTLDECDHNECDHVCTQSKYTAWDSYSDAEHAMQAFIMSTFETNYTPELLEVLEQLVDVLDATSDEETNLILDKAIAIISQARGNS